MFILLALVLVLWAVCAFTDQDGLPLMTPFGTARERRLYAELHRLRTERRRAEEAAARTPSGWRLVGEAKGLERAAKRRVERDRD